jgi:hypothetical protein
MKRINIYGVDRNTYSERFNGYYDFYFLRSGDTERNLESKPAPEVAEFFL